MSSIFDLMSASFWPVQPFMPPPDPTQAFARPSASAPIRTLPPIQAPPPSNWPTTPVDARPYADASVSSWDRAMRQALAAQASATGAPDIHSAFSDQTLAKRAHDFVMWAFGPPSAPKTGLTSMAMLSGVPQYFGGASSNVDAGSADAMPPPMRASGADDGNALSGTPAADRQANLGAAYGNHNIALQGARARAIAAMRAPPAPAIGDLFSSLPRGILKGVANTASASGEAAQLEMQQPVDVPSGDEATDIVERNVTGPLPKPQGLGGQVGETIGEFLGNPMSYIGPGSLAAKLLQATMAAIGSETAGQLARNTWAEPIARIGGGMLGGAAAASGIQRAPAAVEAEAANAARGAMPRSATAPVEPVHTPPVEPSADIAGLPHVDPAIVPLVPDPYPEAARDLQSYRASINVPSRNTVGVARTSVPGLEGQVLEGASKRVRRDARRPPAEPGEIEAPFDNPLLVKHAEEDLANQFKRKIENLGLQPQDLDGHELTIHLSQRPCPSCLSGLDSDAPAGVLKQLSQLYPKLTIHVTWDVKSGLAPRGLTRLIIRNGEYVTGSR